MHNTVPWLSKWKLAYNIPHDIAPGLTKSTITILHTYMFKVSFELDNVKSE